MDAFLKLIDNTDKVTFGLLILINIILWKKEINSCLLYVVFVILLGLVLPSWSSDREIARNVQINGPAMDNFELFYTLLIFPVYWLILLLQLIYISFLPKLETQQGFENILDKE